MTGEIGRIADKARGRQGFAIPKKIFLRTAESMSEQRNRMRSGAGGNKFERRSVARERHSFDADAGGEVAGNRHARREADESNGGNEPLATREEISQRVHF